MINFFGIIHQSGGCGPELLGAIELLRSKKIPVRCIVPEGDSVSRGPRADFLRFLGCSVVNYKPGLFSQCDIVMSFGEHKMFEYMRENTDRPKWVVWSSCMSFPVSVEVRAFKDGLIDEFFFQTKANALAVIKGLKKRVFGKPKFYYRDTYTPYVNPDSGYMRLTNNPRRQDRFIVGRATRDDPEKWHDESWRMYSSVLAPKGKQVNVEVFGWGDEAFKKVGNPCDPTSRWHDYMNICVATHVYDPVEMGKFYGRIHVLMHYYPFVESFGIATAQAMLSGAVPIGADSRGFQEQIIHGESGFLCQTPDEAAFYASLLAFHEPIRQKMSLAAEESARANVGNPEKAWGWWEGLLNNANL